jgi:hypothetical protein
MTADTTVIFTSLANEEFQFKTDDLRTRCRVAKLRRTRGHGDSSARDCDAPTAACNSCLDLRKFFVIVIASHGNVLAWWRDTRRCNLSAAAGPGMQQRMLSEYTTSGQSAPDP